jgi:hypothetical protein
MQPISSVISFYWTHNLLNKGLSVVDKVNQFLQPKSLLHKWQKLAFFIYRATAKPLQERNDFVPA